MTNDPPLKPRFFGESQTPFEVGPESNPHADLAERPFSPGETEVYRRDLADAIPISGVDVAGFDDPLVQEHMPATIAGEITLFVERRMKPGAFLYLMLTGEFSAARFGSHAEPDDMPIIAYWIWRYAPRESFGSAEAVSAWVMGQQ